MFDRTQLKGKHCNTHEKKRGMERIKEIRNIGLTLLSEIEDWRDENWKFIENVSLPLF